MSFLTPENILNPLAMRTVTFFHCYFIFSLKGEKKGNAYHVKLQESSISQSA